MNVVTSRQNPRVKMLADLARHPSKDADGLFIVEGYHLLEMALKSQAVVSVITVSLLPNIPEAIEQMLVSPDVLAKISAQVNPQGVIAVCRKAPFRPEAGPRVLYLDGVADPGNVGTLIRTALAFSFTDVLLAPGCASLYNDKTVNASQGALFDLNIGPADAKALKTLAEKGYRIIVTSLSATQDINQLQAGAPFVLVLGNEARGITPEADALATDRVIIPMAHIDSLNVAVAGGIAMHALRPR